MISREHIGFSYPSCCSTHSPCRHGWGLQKSAPEWHKGPWVPAGHEHWKPLILSTHVPPLRHGLELHSSISSVHLSPDIEKEKANNTWWRKPMCTEISNKALYVWFYVHVCVCVWTDLCIQVRTHICTRLFHLHRPRAGMDCWRSHHGRSHSSHLCRDKDKITLRLWQNKVEHF